MGEEKLRTIWNHHGTLSTPVALHSSTKGLASLPLRLQHTSQVKQLQNVRAGNDGDLPHNLLFSNRPGEITDLSGLCPHTPHSPFPRGLGTAHYTQWAQ